MNAAYIYAEPGDLPKALQAWEPYASLAPPNNWNAASVRGDILTCNEHYDEALEQYRLAEKTKPTLELRRLLVLLGRIGEAEAYLGRHGEAAGLCSRLTRSRNHARWEYSLDLVRALLQLGRLADAEAELTWLIHMLLDIGGGPDTWLQFSMLTYLLARYHLGQVRERTGRRVEAAEWYRFFLSSFEHSAAKLPQIAEARAALKRL